MTRFSGSTLTPASMAETHHFTTSELPKSSMSIWQTIRKGPIRTNWTLTSYITAIHGDAISCIDLLYIGTMRYVAIGSYDGVVSIWSVVSPTLVHRKQKFTLQSAPMRTIQVARGAIIVCNAGHVYHLLLDDQPRLWYELNRPLIAADLAVPSPYLVAISKSNCIILVDISEILKVCPGGEGKQPVELSRKQPKEILISDVVESTQSRMCTIDLDGTSEHIPQVTEPADFQPTTPANAISNALEDSEIEAEDVCARTAYIACACLLTPTCVVFVCSHGFFYFYNFIQEEIVFKFQLPRNAIATCISTTYIASTTGPFVAEKVYISAADGSLTVWNLVAEKKELQPIAMRSNYGSAVSCITLSNPQFVVLGLSNGKIKIYEVDNINHSVGVCRAVPDDQSYQIAGVACALWLDQDTIIAGSWDRGVFIYTRPCE
ncbi:Hypothetical protein GLP15_650 [Giardia lamblia P15]|uniref:WD-repeat family protein n=1 Tax=Giardia intestinalis (strain P15) TaxID=658858 RepID=E1F5B5_GIAIA|nr:Hypothetical protein GLP15_650 [Giardia lamblia P15]